MRSSARFAVWITLGYLIFASAWIFAGEPFVRSFVAQGAGSAEFQILEKILFILVTTAFLYGHSLNMLRLGRRSRIDSDPQARTAPAMLSGATIAVTGAAILVLVVIAAVGLELHQNHDKTVEDARIESANLAGALNNEVQESVATVDHALRGIATDLPMLSVNANRQRNLQSVVDARKSQLAQVQSVFILDRDGRMEVSSDQVTQGSPFGDRDFFVYLRDHASDDLYIGQVTRSRVDGRPFIGLARRLLDSQGAFAGVVAARLDPQFFEDHFRKLRVGEHGVVTLLSGSGQLFARTPPLPSIGGLITPGLDPRLRDPAYRLGTFIAKSPFDGRDRIYAFERVDNGKFIVLVGRDCEDVLAAWYSLIHNALAALAVFVALVIFLSLGLRRQALAQARLIVDLRRSEQRFLSFLSHTPAIAWITDRDARVIYANQALARLVDQDEEQLIGMPLDQLLPTGKEATHADNIGLVATRLENIESVQAGPGAPGQCELLIQYFPLGETQGEHRIGGIALDVSKQRAAERALALYDRVLHSSPHGVSIAVAEGDMPLIYVNPAFERITGYSGSEVIGQNCRFLQGSDLDQEALIEIRAAIRERRETEVTIRNFRKDGTLFWNELRLAPVRDSFGQVTHYVGTQVDVTERKSFEEQLAFQGSHDLLTRLPNRHLFEDYLERAINTASHSERRLAVVFIDIDHFHQCNDSLGRGGGDLLLKRVADRLERAVGANDRVGRVGGDEFALLLLDQFSEDQIRLLLKQLFDAFGVPERVGDLEISLSISAGVALFPRDAQSVDGLSKNAELAMNSAKEAGGGVTHWFQPYMDRHAAERLARETRLRRALERDELTLHYQPQFDARSGKLVGIEALMRWQDPTVGLVPPARFIPLAEDTGLIVPMGEWALRAACQQNRAWQLSGVAHVPIAVNVSIAQFRQANFAQVVRQALNDTGMAAKDLEIEITESLVMDDPELFIDTLRELKRIGVCISIDDFGTGYSSLNYLKRLPIDKLKIDRSFVGDITHDPDDAALCRSIVDIAHSLRLLAIAEGVETEAQAHFLARHHCDHLQGFLFCKPMPAGEVELYFGQTLAFAPTATQGVRALSTVLVVDDDRDSAHALDSVLSSPSIRVLTAHSAAEAFEILAVEDVALLISDYRMPDMNGVTLLTRVKLLYPDTIRMMVTAYPAFEQAADAINQAAIFKFVVKPWDAQVLREDVDHALELHRRLIDSEHLRDTLDLSSAYAARRLVQ